MAREKPAAGRKQFATSLELCEYVRDISGDTAVLSFSYGKDAVACWLQMRRVFKRIVPFYLAPVPGLAFIEDSLRYYEDFFQTPIHRYAHPNFFRMLNQLTFQPPNRINRLEEANFHRNLHYDDIAEDVLRREKCPDAFVATGVRAADSAVRRLTIKKNGPINYKRRTFYPVFDWKQADLLREFAQAKVRMSKDYAVFGRTFDGLQYDYLVAMKRAYPEDYQRLLFWFPMAEMELLQHETALREERRNEAGSH